MPPYHILDDLLEFTVVILVLTKEVESLSLCKDFAAQIAVGSNAVRDAHAKPTEHDGDDAA